MPDEKTIAITIDGQKIKTEAGARIWEVAQVDGGRYPPTLPPARHGVRGGVPRVRRRGRGRANARSLVSPEGRARHGDPHANRARPARAENAGGHADGRPRRGVRACKLRTHRTRRTDGSQQRREHTPAYGNAARARFLIFCHRRGPQRVHSVRSLHPRLHGRSGQQRHRPGRQGRERAYRIRCGFAHGRIHLRLLRGVHGRLPHGRAHQQIPHAANRPWRLERGGFNLPLLRRGLFHHL